MIISSMESGAPGTKSRTCLHIDLWTRSAVYFQALDKQVGRTLPPPKRCSPSFATVQKRRIFLHFFLFCICAHPPPFAIIPQIDAGNFVGLGGRFSMAEDREKSPPNPQIV